MVRRIGLVMAVLLMMAVAIPAFAADIKFNGDFNNRFMLFTNHYDWVKGAGDNTATLDDGSVNETFGEAKYRFWANASTDDGKVSGVWAFEVGGLKYGDAAKKGGYSGDGINFETRWLYTDFQLPWACDKARVRMGLQSITVNKYLWSETAMGVVLNGSSNGVDYQAGWIRPYNDPVTTANDDAEDLDAFFGRVNFKPTDGLKVGIFALYMDGNDDDPAVGTMPTPAGYEVKRFNNNYDLSLLTLGTDGAFAKNNFFVNWDLMYEDGSVDDIAGAADQDLSAWFGHVDLGFKVDSLKFTYTFWYASGDDNPNDNDFDGFLSVDVDTFDNICLFEGGFTDDNYFTERPYLLDKGFIMNKLAVDYKANKKLTVGAAAMYMMTAEDIKYTDNHGKPQKDDQVGVEFDAYLSYKLYDSLEFAVNAGYLFAGDALDYFEVDKDGSADEDIFISTMRVRYKF
ncbi:MAG: alginate export family protein [Deltaproteobacteria bacterium]|nr:alginate export family protein [Deltaproteobacteria bacterium]